MNIDEQIWDLFHYAFTRDTSIGTPEHWKFSSALITWADDLVDTPEEKETLNRIIGIEGYLKFQALQSIKKADDIECLTSSIEFIRKAKEWFINESRTENR